MRKENRITITEEGRDKDKTFLITEMPAYQAEQWATKAVLALINSGILSQDKAHMGMAAVAEAGMPGFAKLDFQTVQELADEMFECVKIVEPNITRKPTGDDIEEVKTRLFLRAEIFTLHTGFSVAGRFSSLISGLKSPASSPAPISQG